MRIIPLSSPSVRLGGELFFFVVFLLDGIGPEFVLPFSPFFNVLPYKRRSVVRRNVRRRRAAPNRRLSRYS
ncbi:MAG: hypothetical protein IJE77_09665 [Thermoguttaceae bacterium]|nr:hypothetical protein [Thermoguttaceae bacterium]